MRKLLFILALLSTPSFGTNSLFTSLSSTASNFGQFSAGMWDSTAAITSFTLTGPTITGSIAVYGVQ